MLAEMYINITQYDNDTEYTKHNTIKRISCQEVLKSYQPAGQFIPMGVYGYFRCLC